MTHYPITIRPFGVHAILIEWPAQVDENILENILYFQHQLKTKYLSKDEWELIPAYNSLTLVFRSAQIHFSTISKQLQDWYAATPESTLPQKFLWKLPVCYDLEFGIDLPEVSEKLDMEIPEVIALHTHRTYTVFGIGFLPGFMYLGGLPKVLEMPRRGDPRARVRRGSVGLAGKQTGIYPQDSPGGWNIIGNCSVPMFKAEREDPCFVNVGDKVQFYPIEKAEYDLHIIEGEVGIYKLEKSIWHA
ncbi:MAG: 5-oxoprolinase subunit PxpB [Bacteroidota bacterium]